jgi:Na+-translocating ferredoxin:NAD+ oxidoreductase RnfD subunit
MSATTSATTQNSPQARKGIDPRWYSSSLLTLILVVGQWKFQMLGDSYLPWAVALSTSLLTELILFRAHNPGRRPNLLSAYISGNSVAILLKPSGAILWPFVVASMLAIVSKYVLRSGDRHLWNPTNFSICALLLIAPAQTTILSHEWGNDPGIVLALWCVGLLVVFRAKVWHLTLGYLGMFAALAWLRTLFNGDTFAAEVGPITGPMYTLFIFFMVTDPKTIVRGRARQMFVLAMIALTECAIRMAADFEILSTSSALAVAPGMFALFFIGAPALLLDLKRPRQASPGAAPLAGVG